MKQDLENIVRYWMEINSKHFDNATFLAEECIYGLELDPDILNDESHWIWELAIEYYEN